MSILSYLIKAPLVPPVAPRCSSSSSCIENIFRACVGLPPDNQMLLEHKRGVIENRLSEAPAAKRAKM